AGGGGGPTAIPLTPGEWRATPRRASAHSPATPRNARGPGTWPGPRGRNECASGGDLLLLVRLQHRLSLLTGADANRLLHRQDEDLAVADVARAGVPEDRLDDQALVLVLDHDLHLELRPYVDRQARPAVGLDDALLTSRSLHLADRQGGESPLEQLGPDRLERLVADECLDLLHVHLLTWRSRSMGWRS